MRYLLAMVLLAHGLVHGLWFVPAPKDSGEKEWPFTLATSPVLTPMGVPGAVLGPLGTVLVVIVMMAFTLSSLGAFGIPGLVSAWDPITLFASVASIVVTILFWNPQFPTSLAIDAVLILTILGNWWPATLVK